jgi:uncharacterized membrane protein
MDAMIDSFPRALTLVAAVGAALVAGVFFAFSTFIMQALRQLPDAQGISAMQAINRAAPSPLFMTALFGSALVCLALAISALTRLREPAALLQLAGSAVYVAGVVLTIVYHVPRNDALDVVDPAGAGAADIWQHYLSGWTAWNHVRTLTSLVGSVILVLVLRVK